MKTIRLGLIITVMCAIGGTLMVSSTFADQRQARIPTLRADNHTSTTHNYQKKLVVNQVHKHSMINAASTKIELISPPAELPHIGSRKMNASLKTFAPTNTVKQRRSSRRRLIVKRPATQSYIAKASRPRELFSLVRLLNYAPHPLKEDILKKKPLQLGNSKYWFTIKYDEDWKVSKNDIGHMKGVSFQINVMENNRVVRSLKTPKVRLRASTIRKGQILGIAEVAPFKFTITVDSFTKDRKGIAELVFKLALVG